MNNFSRLRKKMLSPLSAVWAVVSAVLLILSFPDFEIWFLAWFALVPLFLAVEREKDSLVKSFLTGWLFGVTFFFGSCWWLTFAPITYASLPAPLVYLFLLGASSVVGMFPGVFAALFSIALRRFGSSAILLAPFLWTLTEFLRMALTGNNWNAIGYSQAFGSVLLYAAEFGGVLLVGFLVLGINAVAASFFFNRRESKHIEFSIVLAAGIFAVAVAGRLLNPVGDETCKDCPEVVAVQPNVPMNGLTIEKYQELLKRHIELAESALRRRTTGDQSSTTIIFPESPMIFQYGRDEELQEFLRDFAVRNNASVLFNSAEVNERRRILNSAVMIDEKGAKIAQYDKIYLVPFGEYIPFPEPFASRMPAFVGNFEFGKEYDLLPFGDAKGGVMICFESHFGALSREYVRRGADVLVEMTNDGYLGQTPVLRQHLANSVFRAVETNRSLVRVTNVGITAFINERGEVLDAADVYTEATRIWRFEKPNDRQTLYVRFGEWFAWLCSLVGLALLFGSYFHKKRHAATNSQI